MRINHNIEALNAYRQLLRNQNTVSKHLEKLSSGLRINRASDDAAGLSISEKMRSQIRGLSMAERNSLDGISLIQTAEGALASVGDILIRIKELAVQAANGTYDANTDLKQIQAEVVELTKQIQNVKDNTMFNGIKLLDGTANTIKLQIGNGSGETLDLDGSQFDLSSVYGVVSGYDLSTQAGANAVLSTIDIQINNLNAARSYLGANQNRLEHTINNLGSIQENLTAAESRIRDADMALEMTNFTKNNILVQSAQAMLAQANQLPQGMLQLLK
jgi:flagellin